MKRLKALVPMAIVTALTTLGNDYLVTNRSVAVGENVQYAGKMFKGGENVLSSLQQIPNYASDGDKFYFEPGTYTGNVTIAAS